MEINFIYYIDINDDEETEIARVGGFSNLTECLEALTADKRFKSYTKGSIEAYNENGECVGMYDENGEEL